MNNNIYIKILIKYGFNAAIDHKSNAVYEVNMNTL